MLTIRYPYVAKKCLEQGEIKRKIGFQKRQLSRLKSFSRLFFNKSPFKRHSRNRLGIPWRIVCIFLLWLVHKRHFLWSSWCIVPEFTPTVEFLVIGCLLCLPRFMACIDGAKQYSQTLQSSSFINLITPKTLLLFISTGWSAINWWPEIEGHKS